MASDSDDDEPLSLLAKKNDETELLKESEPLDLYKAPARKKRKRKPKKSEPTKRVTSPVPRPQDVWLYLKDLNPAGPYSCLLCSECFISRMKIVTHYIINHKKDFCGICRYFVPDRDSWVKHVQFHIPWQCSQCISIFDEESDLRHHFSEAHQLVYCKLCCLQSTDDEQYLTHLKVRHNVTNKLEKDIETLWGERENLDKPKFQCLLCSKNTMVTNFVNHYTSYHRITLKCFAHFISGKDPPFEVFGVNVSSMFLESEIKPSRLGYVDSDDTGIKSVKKKPDVTNIQHTEFTTEVKQENLSNDENESGVSESQESVKVEEKSPQVDDEEDEEDDDQSADEEDDDQVDQLDQAGDNDDETTELDDYEGDRDFDITSTDIILLKKNHYNYVADLKKDLSERTMPIAKIEHKSHQNDPLIFDCPYCGIKFKHTNLWPHLFKMHSLRMSQQYACRVCTRVFDSENEIKAHADDEMKEFDDLWLCQFCDREFTCRETTRTHLNEHWDVLDGENCFSPHLGFKCKYCPCLFWNEPEREQHHVVAHSKRYKADYYKCNLCLNLFSEKVWFVYHIYSHHAAEYSLKPYLLRCLHCGLVLPTLADMRGHFAREHPKSTRLYCKRNPCVLKPFAQRKSFKCHFKSQHARGGAAAAGGAGLECGACDRTFGTRRALAAHAPAHHRPRFKCRVCSDVLRTLDERKLHYMLRHPGHHPFACKQCGASFMHKSTLYSHAAQHRRPEQYVCTYCGKVFTRKDSYREHVLIHSAPRHACSYCPMRFVQRSNMLRHERRHTGERPYACAHCPATFVDKGACSSHIRTHSKELSFRCKYCDSSFVQKSKLNYHMRKHTGENLERCTVCAKMFTSRFSLREHMKTHEEKQEAACPICGGDKLPSRCGNEVHFKGHFRLEQTKLRMRRSRKYMEQKYMLRHVRTVHGACRYRCPVCDRQQFSNAALRQHVLTHSPIKIHKCNYCPQSYSMPRSMQCHLSRRHSCAGSREDMRAHYTTLDARDCCLGLDEETLTRIFGPPNAERVKGTKYLEMGRPKDLSSVYGGAEAGGEDNDSADETEIEKVTIKIEKPETDSEPDVELEPTDFVSIKIECVTGDEPTFG